MIIVLRSLGLLSSPREWLCCVCFFVLSYPVGVFRSPLIDIQSPVFTEGQEGPEEAREKSRKKKKQAEG